MEVSYNDHLEESIGKFSSGSVSAVLILLILFQFCQRNAYSYGSKL